MERKKIVVMGGGTGTFTALSGLKKYHTQLDITAIITMADSGGSTGRLRDQFGYLPVGDVRMALAALSTDVDDHDQLLRELFLHRFSKGEGLDGHNFGNLLLVALTDILGSEKEAIKTASRILNIRGTVLPVTEDHVHLVATYDDGAVIEGETHIDEPAPDRKDHRITELKAAPVGTITAEADAAIRAADLVLIGPADLYSSLLANCVIDGVPAALKETSARVVYATNLMSRPGQTRGMKVSDYIAEIERYVDREPDVVLLNNAPLPADVVHHYAQQGDAPVEDDASHLSAHVIRADFLAEEQVEKKAGDVLTRSLIRHDSDKLAVAIMSLLS